MSCLNSLLPSAVTNTKRLQHDFIVMSWIKPAVVLRALRKGYAVMSAGDPAQPTFACIEWLVKMLLVWSISAAHSSFSLWCCLAVTGSRDASTCLAADTDVAYTVKPVWESYLELIHRNDADGAWQAEAPCE